MGYSRLWTTPQRRGRTKKQHGRDDSASDACDGLDQKIRVGVASR
jgi:hypothetical protein